MMYVSAALERHAGFRAEANRQHVALFEAMRARDVAGAIDLTQRHVALPVKATEEVMGEESWESHDRSGGRRSRPP